MVPLVADEDELDVASDGEGMMEGERKERERRTATTNDDHRLSRLDAQYQRYLECGNDIPNLGCR